MRSSRFAAKQGHSTQALAFGRQAWLDLVEQFRQASVDLQGGVDLTRERELVLKGALRRVGGHWYEADRPRVRLADLPIDGVSAYAARDAFAAAAGGFLVSAGERRLTFARLLAEACACCRDLLDEETRRLAAGWQRQFRDD